MLKKSLLALGLSLSALLPASAECPPGCTHRSPGIGCALDDLVQAGGATPGRLASFRRLIASRGGVGDVAGG